MINSVHFELTLSISLTSQTFHAFNFFSRFSTAFISSSISFLFAWDFFLKALDLTSKERLFFFSAYFARSSASAISLSPIFLRLFTFFFASSICLDVSSLSLTFCFFLSSCLLFLVSSKWTVPLTGMLATVQQSFTCAFLDWLLFCF